MKKEMLEAERLEEMADRAAKQIAMKADELELDRTIAQLQLRADVIHAARKLLPAAIEQAQPHGKPCKHCGRRDAGSPALLRLICRIAMRGKGAEPKELSGLLAPAP
jgi:hypothetical protein